MPPPPVDTRLPPILPNNGPTPSPSPEPGKSQPASPPASPSDDVASPTDVKRPPLKEYEADLAARQLEAAKVVGERLVQLKDAAVKAYQDSRRTAVGKESDRLAKLFPDAKLSFPPESAVGRLFPGETSLAAITQRLSAAGDVDPTAVAELHRELRKFRRGEATRLEAESEGLEKEHARLVAEAQAKRSDPPAMRAAAEQLEKLEKRQAELHTLAQGLSPKRPAKVAAPKAIAEKVKKAAEAIAGAQARDLATRSADSPLQLKVKEAQKLVDNFKVKVDQKGCLCQAEWSTPSAPDYYGTTYRWQLCVLRSAETGQARVWTYEDAQGCANSCQFWRGSDAYVNNFCSSQGFREKTQRELTEAQNNLTRATEAVTLERRAASASVDQVMSAVDNIAAD